MIGLDRRYAVTREGGAHRPYWAVRYCGHWLGAVETRRAAYGLVEQDKSRRAAELCGRFSPFADPERLTPAEAFSKYVGESED